MPNPPRRFGVVLSCEHASRSVPKAFAAHVPERLLESHRGYDPGALGVARALEKRLGAPLHTGEVSRLLIDLNRSLHHQAVFSAGIRALPAERRRWLELRYYAPFRDAVAQSIRDAIVAHGLALHLSVHSFTPVLGGERRNADVGLLYDPARPVERAFAAQIHAALASGLPGLRLRRNYPYRGTADGHTTALRKAFSSRRYAGIELELNQAWITAARTRLLANALVRLLR